jgi:predicted transcriptional regulator
MRFSQQHITEAELTVLNTLWDRGASTARTVAEAIYRRCGESEIGAVHSLLKRLESKRLVERDRSSHVHLFSAAVTRETVAGRELEAAAMKLSDGSLAPLVVHLVENRRFTSQEIEALRRLLNEYS